MSDIWIWRAWGDVWQVGDTEDFLAAMAIRCVLTVLLTALTVIVIIPVLLYEIVRSNKEEAQTRDSARLLGVDPSRLGPCRFCGNEQMRDGRPCVRCGRG